MNRTIIVLVMHGTPPSDFPKRELAEFFALPERMAQATGAEREALRRRHEEIEARMRAWPRTSENDPFHAGSHELAAHLGRAAQSQVIVAFNEFCAPSVDEALDRAAANKPDRVVVITPMMTRGGGHSESDIPKAVERARLRNPGVAILYAWPFDAAEVAGFLAAQVARFSEPVPTG